MKRRELLRFLGAAGALPLLGAMSAEELLEAGRALNARGRAGHSLQAFTPHQARTVAAIAEAIIPATDTPGAIGAGVPAFIDLIVAEWYGPEERAAFLAALADLDARSREDHGADFADAAPDAQVAMLEALERGAREWSGPGPAPLFPAMKHLTLWGYYTSEVGAVQELHYETIPGQFNGCVPIPTPEQR